MRKMRGFVMTAAVALSVGWFGSRVWSDDPPKGAVPDEAAEMAKWKKFGAPGEEHARMKAFAGTWDTKTVAWGKESTGSATNALVFGGRYLTTEYKGTFAGEPFEGRGLLAYDNGTKRWSSMWIDSGGTAIVVSDGEEKEKGKVWEFKAKFAGPDGPIETRDVWTVVSDKEFKIESYMAGMGDEPMMTIRFTKK